MADYINIATREHEEREVTYLFASGKRYSESTGCREVVKYTGTWDDLSARAAVYGGGGGAYGVTVTVSRGGGGMAEMTVTRERYRIPDDSGDGDDDGGDDGGLGSEGDPTYTCTVSQVQEPILAQKRYESLSELEKRALKAMMDGMDVDDCISDGSGKDVGGGKKIKDCITSEAGKEAYGYFSRGIFYHLVPSTVVTARWEGSGGRYEFGQIVKSVPGGFKAPGNCDFMCVGTSKEKNGKKVVSSATFQLSGSGGWDKKLYGGGS